MWQHTEKSIPYTCPKCGSVFIDVLDMKTGESHE
jgi:predicted RNA-binding Zn-ribbon protein involved in translation (DUF1610 family)